MKPNDKLVSDLQKMHEADLERIKKFRLLDDDFMSKVFEDSECAEILLKIILNRDDLKVQDVLMPRRRTLTATTPFSSRSPTPCRCNA